MSQDPAKEKGFFGSWNQHRVGDLLVEIKSFSDMIDHHNQNN